MNPILRENISLLWPKETFDGSLPRFVRTQVKLLIIGIIFWIMRDAYPISPDVWGEFAISFPTSIWAMWTMVGCSITLIGLWRGGYNYLSLMGYFMGLCNFGVLAYSIIFTGGEITFGIYAVVFFLELMITPMIIIIKGWKDGKRTT